MSDEKTQSWARCDKCHHRHVFAYMPMEAMKVVKLMHRLSCPMCGNTDTDKFYLSDSPVLKEKK